MLPRCKRYDNDFPSVTTILDQLRKLGLEFWFKKNTPEFIEAESKKAKQIGTDIHKAIESHIELNDVRVETQYPDEVMNALKGFMLFKKENPNIKLKKAEIKMTSQQIGVNGMLDCVGNDGVDVIFDWKSGKVDKEGKPPIYDEYIYQVAAYVRLYNETQGANIQKAVIVALAKDAVAYTMRVIEEDEIREAFSRVFLPLVIIWNYRNRKEN